MTKNKSNKIGRCNKIGQCNKIDGRVYKQHKNKVLNIFIITNNGTNNCKNSC